MDAGSDESPRSALVSAALKSVSASLSGGGGKTAPAACFVKTVVESARTQPWWLGVLLGLCLGVASKWLSLFGSRRTGGIEGKKLRS